MSDGKLAALLIWQYVFPLSVKFHIIITNLSNLRLELASTVLALKEVFTNWTFPIVPIILPD